MSTKLSEPLSLEGILLVNKPSGWTSFDVINYIRKIVALASGRKTKSVKVGHAGTLDPLATGLLVVLVGAKYTKRAAEFSKLDKTYLVTMHLGETSITGDNEGAKQPVSDRVPSPKEINDILKNFSGEMMQVPPAYSAIKINGQRAYDLARSGQVVTLSPRAIKVYSNLLTDYHYPTVSFESRVSSGTYIRSLVTDMGQGLKVGAYLDKLCRQTVGQFTLDDAVSVKNLTAELIEQHLQHG